MSVIARHGSFTCASQSSQRARERSGGARRRDRVRERSGRARVVRVTVNDERRPRRNGIERNARVDRSGIDDIDCAPVHVRETHIEAEARVGSGQKRGVPSRSIEP